MAASSLGQSSTDSTADEEDKQQVVSKQVMKKRFYRFKIKKKKLSRALYLVEIFGPFWVQVTVRFLCLWFENANDFLKNKI